MSASDLAAVIVAAASVVAVVLLAVGVTALLRTLRALRDVAHLLRTETVPVLDDLRDTVDAANGCDHDIHQRRPGQEDEPKERPDEGVEHDVPTRLVDQPPNEYSRPWAEKHEYQEDAAHVALLYVRSA